MFLYLLRCSIGFIKGLFGGGTNFKAKSADLVNPVTGEQATGAISNANTSIQDQQAFLQALANQGGLQNQSNVFNALQQMYQGQGPNPAQAMLNNATGQNVANQMAMAASQRGAGANAGMIARQAAQAGSNAQQQAAGQGAQLQAQQQANALSGMGNMANQMAAQQQNQQQFNTNANLQQQQNMLNQINSQNQANLGNVQQQNNANAQIQSEIAKGQMNMFGNLMGAAGSAMMGMPALGGLFGTAVKKAGSTILPAAGGMDDGTLVAAEGGKVPSKSHYHAYFTGGPTSKVPALVSPGEKYLTPQDVQKVAAGANPMEIGKTVPGTPKVGGAKNSYANDTVKAQLDEGGIVLPRSVTKSKNPDQKAEEFVLAVMRKHGHPLKKGK